MDKPKEITGCGPLLDIAIETVSSKKLVVVYEPDENYYNGTYYPRSWDAIQAKVGRYIKIYDEDDEPLVFFTGFHNICHCFRNTSFFILTFTAKTCPAKHWEKISKLMGTSGKYYDEITFDYPHSFVDVLSIYLKREYKNQVFDENVEINLQKQILTGFINEILYNIYPVPTLSFNDVSYTPLQKLWAFHTALLESAIELVPSKKLSIVHELDGIYLWKSLFQAKRYVQINEDNEPVIFEVEITKEDWCDKKISRIELNFYKEQCQKNNWYKIKKLVGTSGKYYDEYHNKGYKDIISESVHFCLRKKYTKQFFKENIDASIPKGILSEFINEAVGKL